MALHFFSEQLLNQIKILLEKDNWDIYTKDCTELTKINIESLFKLIQDKDTDHTDTIFSSLSKEYDTKIPLFQRLIMLNSNAIKILKDSSFVKELLICFQHEKLKEKAKNLLLLKSTGQAKNSLHRLALNWRGIDLAEFSEALHILDDKTEEALLMQDDEDRTPVHVVAKHCPQYFILLWDLLPDHQKSNIVGISCGPNEKNLLLVAATHCPQHIPLILPSCSSDMIQQKTAPEKLTEQKEDVLALLKKYWNSDPKFRIKKEEYQSIQALLQLHLQLLEPQNCLSILRKEVNVESPIFMPHFESMVKVPFAQKVFLAIKQYGQSTAQDVAKEDPAILTVLKVLLNIQKYSETQIKEEITQIHENREKRFFKFLEKEDAPENQLFRQIGALISPPITTEDNNANKKDQQRRISITLNQNL